MTRVEAEVRFWVGAEGTVSDPVVEWTDAPVLVTALTEGLRRWPFAPARYRGTPVTVPVRWRLAFRLPSYGRLVGRVFVLGSRQPLGGAQVAVVPGPTTTTAADGRFVLTVPAGAVTVVVTAPGYVPLRLTEHVGAGERVEVRYRLEPTGGGLELRIVAPRRREEVSRVRVERMLLRAVPGSFDDVVRVVQKLPGVSVPNELSGRLLVRGADARDTRIFVEDVEVPFVFHFGNLKSILATESVEAVELYPSNFSVRYGDAVGGILAVDLRDPVRERWGGRVQIGSFLSEGVVEGPVGDAGVALAVRRSYIGEALDPFLADVAPGSFTVVPRMTDLYGRLVHETGAVRWRWTFLGAIDEAELLLDRERLLDPDAYAHFGYRQAQWHGIGGAEVALGSVTGVNTVALSQWSGDFVLDQDEHIGWREWRVTLRSDWTVPLVAGLALVAGVDLWWRRRALDLYLPRPPRPGEFDYDPWTVPRVGVTESVTLPRGGLYVEWRGFRTAWRWALGLRGDYDRTSDVGTLDPRGQLWWRTSVGTWKAALGLYHQFARDREAVSPRLGGRPEIGPSRAWHVLLGWERRQPPWKLVIESFGRWFQRSIVPDEQLGFDNRGSGYAYGVETTLWRERRGSWSGWINYTFARSLRRQEPGDPLVTSVYDQPHLLNAVLLYHPSAVWEAGLSFRFASGRPLPELRARLYDADRGRWLPFFGASEERFPPYRRLDLRLKRRWLFATWELALLLDVVNVTGAANPLARIYNADFTRHTYVTGLPPAPYLAVEATFR